MKTSKYFFISFILFVFGWLIYLFSPFLLTISIGILLAVSTANINIKFLKLTNNKETISAILTTLTVFLLFLIPFIYAVIQLAKYISNFDISYITQILDYIKNYDFKLPSAIEFLEPKIKDFITSIDINDTIKQCMSYASSVGKSSANFIVDLGLILVFYFFSNLYGKPLINFAKSSLPIENSLFNYIFGEVGNTMSVVLYSTILNAVLQGFLFGSMIIFFDYNGFLLGILYAFASMIPIVGGALVYVPISIYEIANHNINNSIVIFLYSIIIISTIADNFIKPFIIKFINSKLVDKPANINELIIFFSMLAGLSTFGFWGIILGPAIVTLFVATIHSYGFIVDNTNTKV
ncbi:AI-2E family transporter [Campylobacter sp. FMV-PI01]|uniref:AI-2E family transporter n=1 Tax=Campylobacter portucalensis TaxID=2608384 RepID=A0A6L5WJ23_9BACT|nr:AI-2E family transporter [Campylobacter portucalensis]MSN97024.1 AI-2E family transporter [Campylobacter portucalensis]